MTIVVSHSTVTGAAADPSALVDGPKWDAQHVVSGLDHVDNTADLDKPISTATQTALDGKIASSLLTTRGDIITRGTTVAQRLALGASGTYLKSDGTDAVWVAPRAPTVQVLTSGTGATYTTPAGCLWIRIRAAGGGGGGGGSGTGATGGVGGTGGTTTFSGGTISCGGGVGGGGGSVAGGGTATGSGIVMPGSNGGSVLTLVAGQFGGGATGGGSAIFGGGGGAVANTGGGGYGSQHNGAGTANGGGGGGGGMEHRISAPAATYTYTIGAGGTAGTAGTSGGAGVAGSSGCIIVEEFY